MHNKRIAKCFLFCWLQTFKKLLEEFYDHFGLMFGSLIFHPYIYSVKFMWQFERFLRLSYLGCLFRTNIFFFSFFFFFTVKMKQIIVLVCIKLSLYIFNTFDNLYYGRTLRITVFIFQFVKKYNFYLKSFFFFKFSTY